MNYHFDHIQAFYAEQFTYHGRIINYERCRCYRILSDGRYKFPYVRSLDRA